MPNIEGSTAFGAFLRGDQRWISLYQNYRARNQMSSINYPRPFRPQKARRIITLATAAVITPGTDYETSDPIPYAFSLASVIFACSSSTTPVTFRFGITDTPVTSSPLADQALSLVAPFGSIAGTGGSRLIVPVVQVMPIYDLDYYVPQPGRRIWSEVNFVSGVQASCTLIFTIDVSPESEGDSSLNVSFQPVPILPDQAQPPYIGPR